MRIKKIVSQKIRPMTEIPTYGITLKSPSKNTPNMASAANDSNLPSLSSPVPPCGNNGQRCRDGLLQLFAGRNWPLAAAATGKHRHNASTMRCAFTEQINSKNNNIL
jgi:hypothetical protein